MQVSKFIMVLSLFFITFVASSEQSCVDYVPNEHPDSRYSVHNDGTVTDTITKLMWKICLEGAEWDSATLCGGTNVGYNWQQALQRPVTVNTGGGFAKYTDWRLPNIKELSSLAVRNCRNPATNVSIFGFMAYIYTIWSSSPSIDEYSFYIEGSDGVMRVKSRTTSSFVRLVRNGQ